MIWIILAIIIAAVVLLVDSRFYFVFAHFFYALAILLLLYALIFGKEVNASKSWIQIGSFGIQPAEFAKFATALSLAKIISNYGFKILQFKSLIRIGLIILLPFTIILLQNDTGSALVFSSFILVFYREGIPGWVIAFLIFMIALFIFVLIFNKIVILIFLFGLTVLLYALISNRFKDTFRFTLGIIGLGVILYSISEFFHLNLSLYFILLIPIGIGIPIALIYAFIHRIKQILIFLLFLVTTITFSFSVDYVFHNVLDVHHQRRINDLLGIEADPLGWGYNVNQSKIAIGSGGVWGKGYLGGTQTKFNFVPEQSTDFIFCTVGEEWGFIGTFIVVVLFITLLIRLIILAERQREAFSRIYGYSVVAILFFHIAINIGMTIGLFPVIGIPLPFFSYGGSSLWAFTILLFIFIKLDSTRLG